VELTLVRRTAPACRSGGGVASPAGTKGTPPRTIPSARRWSAGLIALAVAFGGGEAAWANRFYSSGGRSFAQSHCIQSSGRLARAMARGTQARLWTLRATGATTEAEALETATRAMLEQGTIAEVEPIGLGRSRSVAVSFEGGERAVAKMDGSAYTDPKREVAAYEIDRLLGLELVPLTVARKLERKLYSLQLFVDDAHRIGELIAQPALGPAPSAAELRAMRFLDYLVANEDRHGDNALVLPSGKLVAIDHGLAFRTDEIQLRDTASLANMLPSREVVERLRTQPESEFRRVLEARVDSARTTAFLRRRLRFLELIDQIGGYDAVAKSAPGQQAGTDAYLELLRSKTPR
jgi:hypothetical protein